MEKRIAAYAFLFVAGVASASLGWALVDGLNGLVRIFAQMEWKDLRLILLAGVAAVVAAVAVRAPFLRAARARRRLRLYGWTLLGVLASHVAYAMLVFFDGLLFESAPLEEHAGGALFIGFISLIFGFIPNTLWGVFLAEIVLWQDRSPRMAPTVG